MGTSSITKIKDEYGETILHMYRQFDGYEECHGKELKYFLKNMQMVNGIGMDKANIANGIGCLAAQLISHFKKEAGGFYLVNFKNDSESYDYTIYPENMDGSHDDTQLCIKVESSGKVLYDGLVKDYDPMREKDEEN